MARTNTTRRATKVLLSLVVLVLLATSALLIGNLWKKQPLTPSLALDLEGGTQMILAPKADANSKGRKNVTQEDIDQAIEIIRKRVDASGVTETEITSQGSSQGGQNIVVSVPGTPDKDTLDLVRSSAQLRFRPVLLAGAPNPVNPTAHAGKDGKPGTPTKDLATAAKETADANKDGKLETKPSGKPKDPSDTAWISEQNTYDFFTRDCAKEPGRHEGTDDPNAAIVACERDGSQKYILGPAEMEGTDVSRADSGQGTSSTGQATGAWVVNLTMNAEGTKKFKALSERLFALKSTDPTRNRFAIVLDGAVVSAPSMNAIIPDGNGQISGNFTAKSAASLANQLKFGSLPLNFDVLSERQISATLGSEHLQKGLWAGLLGLLLVVIYLAWQYRGLSIVALGSLFTAGIMVYGAITLLSNHMGYRLSLAGVAGLIVAVGITADSFIVYFERIRDEVRDGRPLVSAVDEGWARAKRTIIISDMVNLVAAAVLYFLAVGGVQGFAFTLGLTTIIDLIVIIMFTHPLMVLLMKVKFFGQGHRLSGLDPKHLGATSGAVYVGRGQIRMGTGKDDASGMEGTGLSIAERRALAKREEESHSSAAPETVVEKNDQTEKAEGGSQK